MLGYASKQAYLCTCAIAQLTKLAFYQVAQNVEYCLSKSCNKKPLPTGRGLSDGQPSLARNPSER